VLWGEDSEKENGSLAGLVKKEKDLWKKRTFQEQEAIGPLERKVDGSEKGHQEQKRNKQSEHGWKHFSERGGDPGGSHWDRLHLGPFSIKRERKTGLRPREVKGAHGN